MRGNRGRVGFSSPPASYRLLIEKGGTAPRYFQHIQIPITSTNRCRTHSSSCHSEDKSIRPSVNRMTSDHRHPSRKNSKRTKTTPKGSKNTTNHQHPEVVVDHSIHLSQIGSTFVRSVSRTSPRPVCRQKKKNVHVKLPFSSILSMSFESDYRMFR